MGCCFFTIIENVLFNYLFLVVGIDVYWLEVEGPAMSSMGYIELIQMGTKSLAISNPWVHKLS